MATLAKRITFFTLYSTVLVCMLSIPVYGQIDVVRDTTVEEAVNVDEILNQLKEEMQSPESIPDSLISPPPAAHQQLFDDTTLTFYKDAMNAYYQYRVSGFEHRKEVFAWQLFSTKLIFWCVLFLVFISICFSGIQFYKSFGRGPEGAETAEPGLTEFEASAKGIKVTSPVLGVIILVISLVFFYLYLVHVYPIREIF